VDYCRNTIDFMGSWIGEQLYSGRSCSSFTGCCYYRGASQGYSGTTCGVGGIFWRGRLVKIADAAAGYNRCILHDAEGGKERSTLEILTLSSTLVASTLLLHSSFSTSWQIAKNAILFLINLLSQESNL